MKTSDTIPYADMNHRQRYEFFRSKGILKDTPEEVITRLVNQLLQALYKPDEKAIFLADSSRIEPLGIAGEPINWGDLKVCDVKEFKDGSFRVIIEEASPGDCPNLCTYIEGYMGVWGWAISCDTEW